MGFEPRLGGRGGGREGGKVFSGLSLPAAAVLLADWSRWKRSCHKQDVGGEG